MKKPRILEIRWIDSASSNKIWHDAVDALEWHKDHRILHTVGYFLAEDKTFLTVCSSLGGWGAKGGLWTIPKASIVSRRKLG